ncbi:uncharacterized protein LOC131302292 [Rhododendron vialii]|uniref:uncharacterized protein LOC131302292 n=1 Tax=Rhododendron vialii TaxID=182163 RepID=UPI00265EADF3|nr:uncharacterized protein LOC131302292 [Rhododendron vialii]
MAALCSISISPPPLIPKPLLPIPSSSSSPHSPPFLTNLKKNLFSRPLKTGPINSASPSSSTATATAASAAEDDDDESMSIDALHRFIHLNLGKWTGSFHQFDPAGTLMHSVSTKLAVSSYGEDELISLIQTLYIKQPPLSTTSIAGDAYEPEWYEYKIKETNMFTVDKYQQIGFFPKEKAFSLRYQTAGMLETLLRQGVLGEDDNEEESPKNLKIPSRRPSIVCENCLYSLEKDMRARAFHILDPKGIVEMFLIFVEERGGAELIPPSFDNSEDNMSRLMPYLGKWEGHSVTKRSGVYGATIAEADTISVLEIDDEGQLIQNNISTSIGGDVTNNILWKGTMSNNLIKFDDGDFQVALLPGGMYMGCPSDVAKSIAEYYSFHLEFCWLQSPGKRQRLVRTYDKEGMVVSSTYFSETKL